MPLLITARCRGIAIGCYQYITSILDMLRHADYCRQRHYAGRRFAALGDGYWLHTMIRRYSHKMLRYCHYTAPLEHIATSLADAIQYAVIDTPAAETLRYCYAGEGLVLASDIIVTRYCYQAGHWRYVTRY